MEPLGFLALAVFFGCLALDAHQFQRTSRHRVWAVPPDADRAVGVDPLSVSSQAGAQANKHRAIGGIPGLYWVFVVLSLGCLGVALLKWLG